MTQPCERLTGWSRQSCQPGTSLCASDARGQPIFPLLCRFKRDFFMILAAANNQLLAEQQKRASGVLCCWDTDTFAIILLFSCVKEPQTCSQRLLVVCGPPRRHLLSCEVQIPDAEMCQNRPGDLVTRVRRG